MIKRYCDRCGQQIDEGVHAWYVLELHGTDGEFRHKEFCEECYEYLCEKDYVPSNKDFKITYTCSFNDCDNFKNFGFGEKCIECKRKQSEAKHKTENNSEKPNNSKERSE